MLSQTLSSNWLGSVLGGEKLLLLIVNPSIVKKDPYTVSGPDRFCTGTILHTFVRMKEV